MNGALVYLQRMSLQNAVRQRVRRLREPRYLIGLIVGAAYFYFFFFRRAAFGGPGHRSAAAPGAELGLLISLAIVGAIMGGRIVYAWIFSAERPALAFTEAEVAFLFPAPVARRTLVHFKLLKSQLRILLSAGLLAVLSTRFSLLGGSGWIHAAGWWLLLSTVELHGIAASFTRQRLLDLGLRPGLRRVLFGGGALLALAAVVWWVRGHLPPPPAAVTGRLEINAFVAWIHAVLAVPPLPWLLAPFRWVLGPFFAVDTAAFLRAVGPALLVLAAHYVWVVRAEVSFEEASIDLARRRAERLASLRAGGGYRSRRPTRRRDPFPLRPGGSSAPAFLWRNLISAGPWFYPRNALLLAAVLLAGIGALAASPAYRPWLAAIQGLATGAVFWILFGLPMLLRRQVHLLFERLDVIKTLPLRGWQVVLGELLAPIVLLTAVEWFLLAVIAITAGALYRSLFATAVFTGLGAVGIALLVPPVAGLMSAVPFAAALFFPDWVETLNQPRGMDVMGQRLIFAGGYLVVLLVALLPAALAAAVPLFVVHWLVGAWSVAALAGGIAASLVLAGELAAVIWWLGGRWERFDLSRELPQT